MSEAGVMSFRDHLGELRTRLIRGAIVLTLGFFVCWSWRVELFALLSYPISEALADNGIYRYQAIHITESILVYLKSSFVAAILLTAPFTFYQAWAFVGPGLLKREQHFLVPVTFFTVVFFVIGSAFAYQVILPFITDWLVKLTLEGGQADVMVTLQNAFSTALVFLVMFGLVFELPLVIFFLSLFGIVTWRGLARFFRYFIVLSFIVSAMLTPPDPISQVLMALPLNVLYLFGILVAWGVERSRSEDGSTPNAGLTLTRLMGSSLLLVALAGVLIGWFVRTLPGRNLHEMLPTNTRYLVVATPGVIANDPQLSQSLTATGPWVEALSGSHVKLTTIRRAALLGTMDDGRALLLRGDGLGAATPEIIKKLGALKGVTAAALDDDTLALGDTSVVTDLSDIAHGRTPALTSTEEERRLIQSLISAGPLWAWLPHPADNARLQIGPSLARQAVAVGAVLQPGDPVHAVLRIHGADPEGTDRIEAILDAARTAAAAQRGVREQEGVVMVLQGLLMEMMRGADAERRKRLSILKGRLGTLRTEGRQMNVPVLGLLGTQGGGWALQRESLRVLLSAEVDSAGLAVIATEIGDLLR